MTKDKMTGSTILPSQILTPAVDTEEVRIGDERFSTISQDYLSGDYKSVPTSKALFDAFTAMSNAVNEIDPDNHFFRDNAVITSPLLSPTFDDPSDWILHGWDILDNKVIYSNIVDGDNNSLKFNSKAFTAPGYYFFKIEIERIDTGSLELIDFDDRILKTYTKKGTYYLEHYVDNPHIASFRLVSKGLYPNEVIVIPSIGLYRVQPRLREYLEYVLSGSSSSGGEDIAELKDALIKLKIATETQISELTDILSIHTGDTLNPHRLSLAILHAAHENHTHTPESIDAARKNHSHEPSEIGASEVGHHHIPSECGAAPDVHQHTPEECGAAPLIHPHPELVTKNEHATDMSLLEQKLLAMIDDEEIEGILGSKGAEGTPLSLVKVDPKNRGIGHSIAISSAFKKVDTVCKTGRPEFTIKTNSIYHLNAGDYDQNMGILSYFHSTIPPKELFLKTSIDGNKAYPHDIIRTSIDSYIPSLKEDGTIPIIEARGINSSDPLTFKYNFHIPLRLNSLTFMRILDNRIDTNITKITTQGGCLHKANLRLFNSGNLVGEQDIQLDITDWKGASVVVPIISTEGVDEFVLQITDVHPLVSDSWDNAVWSLKIKPNINGTANEVELLDASMFVGYIEGVKGVSDIVINVPKYTTIPTELISSPPSPRSYLTLYSASGLAITDGKYDIKTDITPLGVEVTSTLPRGFDNAMKCSEVSGQSVDMTHPYWGTGSSIFLSNNCTHLTHASGVRTSPKFSFKRPVTLSGLTIWINTGKPTSIQLILLNSKNKTTVKEFTVLGSKVLGESSTNYACDLELDELYQDLTSIEVIVGSDPTIRISHLDLRLVGIHYNPNTRKVFDYHNDRPIICVVGSIVPIEPIGGDGVKYFALPSTNDSLVVGTKTSEMQDTITYVLPGIVPAQDIEVKESVSVSENSHSIIPIDVNILVDRGIYQFKTVEQIASDVHFVFE